MQNYIGEFPKQCESKEFLCEICERSYMSENDLTEVTLGGENLDSDVSMHRASLVSSLVIHFW